MEIRQKGDKFYCNDSFSVSSIGYSEDREITELKIVNGKGRTVYELKAKEDERKSPEDQEMPERSITKAQMNSLNAELERTGVTMEAVQKRYRIQTPETMSENSYNKVMAALARTKSAGAA